MRAYLGLGANLDQPIQQLCRAINRLQQQSGIEQLRSSHFYASTPMGPQNQPDYVNAVVEIETHLSPLALLDVCQHIENEQQRRRALRWGARTLDIDILSIADIQMQDERLTLPHPGIIYRDFVVLPWQTLASDYTIPSLGKVSHLQLIGGDYQAMPIDMALTPCIQSVIHVNQVT